MRGRAAFVRIEPRFGERASTAESTLRWSTGDGSEGVVALVQRDAEGGGREELIGLVAAAAGSVDLEWLNSESGHQLRLYPRSEWDARGQRKPRAIAATAVRRSSIGLAAGGPSEEVAADVVFVALVVGWAVGLVSLAILGLVFAARRLRG